MTPSTMSTYSNLPSFTQEELGTHVWAALSPLQRGDRVLLEGPLGAGKTTLARIIIEKLGVVSMQVKGSPTFPIVHSYSIGSLKVSHVDLYRLTSPRELEERGVLEILYDPEHIVFIEWMSKFPELEVMLRREFKLQQVSLRFVEDDSTRRKVTTALLSA